MVNETDKKWTMKNQLEKELSKAYFGIGKFISLHQNQREELLRIVDLICNYISNKNAERPVNIFIQAPPGVGKTFLVKQLKSTLEETLKLKIQYYNFNLSYMSSPDDIISAFRKVQSVNIKKEIPIVFFDEIDAGLGDRKDAYRYFLTPMFEGIIYDKGDELYIGKAIIFYAASKTLEKLLSIDDNEIRNENNSYENWVGYKNQLINNLDNYGNKEDKLIDFLDRIDEYIFLPPAEILFNGDSNLIEKQTSLLVTAMIFKHFPDITAVEDLVIAVLTKCMISLSSRRKIDSIIFKSTQPKDGQFRSENMPPSFLDAYNDIIEEYEKIKVK